MGERIHIEETSNHLSALLNFVYCDFRQRNVMLLKSFSGKLVAFGRLESINLKV